LAEGLEYIHSKNLIHRDIKPGNVLIYVDSTDGKITMKFADFDLSRPVNERGTFTMSSGFIGTRNWYAPELLKLITQLQQSTQRRGTVKSDVFALGLVFVYLLIDGQHLYGSNEIEIMANIVANKQVNIKSKFST
jgi:serine/threonine protein kinase